MSARMRLSRTSGTSLALSDTHWMVHRVLDGSDDPTLVTFYDDDEKISS
jgi:hypothetical protein